jgi:hypothetical protein
VPNVGVEGIKTLFKGQYKSYYEARVQVDLTEMDRAGRQTAAAPAFIGRAHGHTMACLMCPERAKRGWYHTLYLDSGVILPYIKSTITKGESITSGSGVAVKTIVRSGAIRFTSGAVNGLRIKTFCEKASQKVFFLSSVLHEMAQPMRRGMVHWHLRETLRGGS